MNEETNDTLPLDELFEGLICNALRESAQEPKLLNPARYTQMLEAKEALERLLDMCCGCGPVEVKLHPLFCSAALCVEMDCLEITDMAALAEVMACASNMEVVPLTNGRLHLSFMFKHVFTRIN